MKRNSNDKGGPDRGSERDGNAWDGSPACSPAQESPSGAGSLDGGSLDGGSLDGWDKEDFEAALPLYVGGELDALDALRVEAWLAAHPEGHEALAASKDAAKVLAQYAEFTRQRETPDLWAGIRSDLLASGMLSSGAAASGQPSNDVRSSEEHLAPILGGPRWFQRKSVAAAAALLLTGSVGLFLVSRGAAPSSGGIQTPISSVAAVQAQPSGSALGLTSPDETDLRSAADLASLAGEELLSGESGTAESPLVSIPVGLSLGNGPRRRGAQRARGPQRLQVAQQGAERLIDDAPKALLWQSTPWVDTRLGADPRGGDAQLTGGH